MSSPAGTSPKRTGRPSTALHPTVVVAVDGRTVAWSDGIFAGDRDLVEFSRSHGQIGAPLALGRATFTPDASTPLGAAKLMLAAGRGRGRLISGVSEEQVAADLDIPQVPTWAEAGQVSTDVPLDR